MRFHIKLSGLGVWILNITKPMNKVKIESLGVQYNCLPSSIQNFPPQLIKSPYYV